MPVKSGKKKIIDKRCAIKRNTEQGGGTTSKGSEELRTGR